MKTQVSISKIKPSDTGEHIAEMIEKFESKVVSFEKTGYSSGVAKTLGLIVEFGLMDTKDWIDFIDECP